MASIDLDQRQFLGGHPPLEIERLFQAVVKLGGSHLHLKVGRRRSSASRRAAAAESRSAGRRGDGAVDLSRCSICKRGGSGSSTRTAAWTSPTRLDYEQKRWRFRVNVMQQLGHVGLVAMRGNNVIPDFEALHLPPSLADLCTLEPRDDPAWRASPARARARPLPRCSTGSTTATASTSSPSRTRSSSPSPTTSA